MNLTAAMGITTGQVFCGIIGSEDIRCEYCIVGDTVNTAARLMCKVENFDGIITDENTYEEVQKSMQKITKTSSVNNLLSLKFKKMGIIKVKGKKDKVPIYAPYYAEAESNKYIYSNVPYDRNYSKNVMVKVDRLKIIANAIFDTIQDII